MSAILGLAMCDLRIRLVSGAMRSPSMLLVQGQPREKRCFHPAHKLVKGMRTLLEFALWRSVPPFCLRHSSGCFRRIFKGSFSFGAARVATPILAVALGGWRHCYLRAGLNAKANTGLFGITSTQSRAGKSIRVGHPRPSAITKAKLIFDAVT